MGEMLDGFGLMYFTVMSSVFDPAYPIHETYDVKGSTFKRKRKEGEKIGKDEDWVNLNRRLDIPDDVRSELCAAHEQDAALLERCGVMDYSLLIGIHNLDSGKPAGTAGWIGDLSLGIVAVGTPVVYFVGMIDFLIWYGLKKEGEHLLRAIQGHGEDASCVDPLTYARRQVRFVRDSVVQPAAGDAVFGTRGALVVTLSCAHNLRKADLNLTSDPYAWVALGLQRHRTLTVNKNCDPQWGCTMAFAVDESHIAGSVEVTVWDEDIGSADFLGRLSVPLHRVLDEGTVDLKEADLEGVQQGSVTMRLEFRAAPTASSAPPVHEMPLAMI